MSTTEIVYMQYVMQMLLNCLYVLLLYVSNGAVSLNSLYFMKKVSVFTLLEIDHTFFGTSKYVTLVGLQWRIRILNKAFLTVKNRASYT
jgi:hypothetical protein